MMDESIRFTCSRPECGARLKVAREQAGRRARCNKCGEKVLVPNSEPVPVQDKPPITSAPRAASEPTNSADMLRALVNDSGPRGACQSCNGPEASLATLFWAAKSTTGNTANHGSYSVSTITYEGLTTFRSHLCKKCVRRFSLGDAARQLGLFSLMVLAFIGLYVFASDRGLPITASFFSKDMPSSMGLLKLGSLLVELFVWAVVGLYGVVSGFYLFHNVLVCLGLPVEYSWSIITRRAAIHCCKANLKAEGYKLFYEKHPSVRGLPQ